MLSHIPPFHILNLFRPHIGYKNVVTDRLLNLILGYFTRNYPYTGCHRRNGPNFGRVFLMLNYTDITQNTYIQS